MGGYLLGIDQGGSHTWAVAARLDGELLALGRAPGSCHAYSGMAAAMDCVQTAALDALDQAGISARDLAIIFGGLTGADWADEYPLLERAIHALGLCEQVKVENDSIIALRGGTDRRYGVILIAGSGGNCAVRAPDGRQFTFGYFWDDEVQGGGALGRHVIEAIYHSYTGTGPETSLTGRVLDLYGLDGIEALKRADVEGRLHTNRAGTYQLPLILFEETLKGDAVASQVVRVFGEGYAMRAVTWLRRFDMTGLEFDVVLSGSIFKAKTPLLIESVSSCIFAAAPKARLVNARYEPVVGAVLLGLEQLGIEITPVINARIEASARRLGLIRPEV
jgi:N-acetylglucosamine kinase-like BadF-type ATPase